MDLAASLLCRLKAEAHDDALKSLNTVATSGQRETPQAVRSGSPN